MLAAGSEVSSVDSSTVSSRVSEAPEGGWLTTSQLNHRLLKSGEVKEVTVECLASHPTTTADHQSKGYIVSPPHVVTVISKLKIVVVVIVVNLNFTYSEINAACASKLANINTQRLEECT